MKWIIQTVIAVCVLASIGKTISLKDPNATACWFIATLLFIAVGIVCAKKL